MHLYRDKDLGATYRAMEGEIGKLLKDTAKKLRKEGLDLGNSMHAYQLEQSLFVKQTEVEMAVLMKSLENRDSKQSSLVWFEQWV